MYADAMANTWKTKGINMYAQRTPVAQEVIDDIRNWILKNSEI